MVRQDDNYFIEIIEKYNKNNFNINFIRKDDCRKSIIEYICPNHKEYIQSNIWMNFNKNKELKCLYCKREKEYIKKLNKLGYTLKSKYNGAKDKCLLHCKKHKEDFYGIRNHVLSKRHGCPSCMKEKQRIIYKNDFIKKSKKIYKNEYDYSLVDYKTVMDKVIITCPKHGNYYKTPDAHLRGQGCHKCQISYPENLIIGKLKKYNIKYVYNKPNDLLINPKTGRKLKPDFYFHDLNLIIEYDGAQHFHPLYGIKKLKEIIKMDLLKDKLCEENNIKIVRFNKDNIKELDKILRDELKDYIIDA